MVYDVSECLLRYIGGWGWLCCCNVVVGSIAHKKVEMTYIALRHMLLNNKAIMSLDKKVIKAVMDTAHFRSCGVPIKTMKPRIKHDSVLLCSCTL
jgi:hypothetical protein